MATTDSGTETLFSDESPCELAASPSVCSEAEVQVLDASSEDAGSGRLHAPPNIQPYSGVLGKVSACFLLSFAAAVVVRVFFARRAADGTGLSLFSISVSTATVPEERFKARRGLFWWLC